MRRLGNRITPHSEKSWPATSFSTVTLQTSPPAAINRSCSTQLAPGASATILGCAACRALNRMISLFGKPEKVEPTLLERLKASDSKTKAALSESVENFFLGERKI